MLLENNKKWAAKIKENEPKYFETLANIQRPKVNFGGRNILNVEGIVDRVLRQSNPANRYYRL
jgi:hypothetical protein